MHETSAEPALPSLIDQARHRFIARMGRAPQCIAAAPGRVNLIGEHTDYNDGLVLPIAINRWAVAAVGTAVDEPSACIELPDVRENPEVHARSAHFVRTVAERVMADVAGRGLEHAAARIPVNVLALSSVPMGGGLSSSAALSVAVALATDHLAQSDRTRVELAHLCQRAEHEALGTPCGIMDMFTALHAQADHALLLDCRSLEFDHIPLPSVEHAALLVIDTGVHHALASSAYTDRQQACQRVVDLIRVSALRDATMQMLEKDAINESDRRRGLHVVMENTRVLLTAAALRAGDMRTVGDLMYASHLSLRDLYEVSCPELDAIVDAASAIGQSGGVYGARMTGGGFGGCAIALIRADEADAIRRRIAAAFESRFGRVPVIHRMRAVEAAALCHAM